MSNRYVVGDQVYIVEELYHHGVKGMKWGVRKKIEDAAKSINRTSRAVSVANINERIASVKRSMERHDARSDRRTRSYKTRNVKFKARLERLKAMRDHKVGDLSPADIERGRSVYKTLKHTTLSVATTAAALVAGTISMPVSIATKLVGAGVSSVVKSMDVDTNMFDT